MKNKRGRQTIEGISMIKFLWQEMLLNTKQQCRGRRGWDYGGRIKRLRETKVFVLGPFMLITKFVIIEKNK